MSTPLLALQIYSARKFAPLDDQLAIVARNGYTHIETFGPFHDDPKASRKQIEAHGLKVRSAHIALDLASPTLARRSTSRKALGANTPSRPICRADARPTDSAGWRAIGEKLQAAARSARRTA